MAGRDNRRIAGPEKTMPIRVLKHSNNTNFLASNGLRQDNRSAEEIRKMYLGLSNISQAKGSSFVEAGDTKVVCGVYGPQEVTHSNTFKLTGQVSCEVRFAPFSCRVRRSPLPDSQSKELSVQLKEALEAAIVLEQYPKSEIGIYVTVVEDGGGLLAACINAASLALCDASISMHDVLVAASMAWHEGTLYSDPSLIEEDCVASTAERLASLNGTSSKPDVAASATGGLLASNSDLNGSVASSGSSSSSSNGTLAVGLMPTYASGQVALMVMSGFVRADCLLEGLDAALEVCRKIFAVMTRVVKNNAMSLDDTRQAIDGKTEKSNSDNEK